MNDTTDRVFLCCDSCLPKIAITKDNIIREVKEVDEIELKEKYE